MLSSFQLWLMVGGTVSSVAMVLLVAYLTDGFHVFPDKTYKMWLLILIGGPVTWIVTVAVALMSAIESLPFGRFKQWIQQ